MTVDEHERRLRDAVAVIRTTLAQWGGRVLDDEGEPDPDALAALDAYAEFVRLRAVAEIGYCLSPMTKCEYGQPGGHYKGRLCEVHEAQQKLDAILADEGGVDADRGRA